MDSLRNLLQIIDENSQVNEQMKPVEPDYEFMGNPPGDPTYKTDPKTGNLIPDIDPTLRPNAPTGPIPGTKPQTGTTPPPGGSAGKPPAPKPSIGTVPGRPKPPSTQDRMPSVPPAGQGVKKVTEKTLEETVDKIIKLIQVNDQLVRENKRKVNEKYMVMDIRNSVQGRNVTEGIIDKLKQKFFPKPTPMPKDNEVEPTPMPKDNEVKEVSGRQVRFNYVRYDHGSYIRFTWRDKNGEEQTEEFPIEDYTDYTGEQAVTELYKDIAAEISHADNPGPMDPGAQAIIDQKRAEDPVLDQIMKDRESAEKPSLATMPTSSTIHEQGVAEGLDIDFNKNFAYQRDIAKKSPAYVTGFEDGYHNKRKNVMQFPPGDERKNYKLGYRDGQSGHTKRVDAMGKKGEAEGSVTPGVSVEKLDAPYDDPSIEEWHLYRGEEIIGLIIKNLPGTAEGLYVAAGQGPGRAFTEDFTSLQSAVKFIASLDNQGVAEAKPGWMLKQDPKLAAKVKAKTDLAKKRRASYGDPSAGKSVDKKGVAEGSEQSPQKQMGQEMRSIIDRLQARMKAADRQYTVPSKPQTAEDLKVRINDIKQEIAKIKQQLDPTAEYSDDYRVYKSGQNLLTRLKSLQNELAAIQNRL